MKDLTAGEECQIAAKSFSSFSGHIPSLLVKECMGMAILKGSVGVSVIRLPSGEWSAPCAIALESLTNAVAPQQETVLLFMSELAIYSLVTRANVALNQTHRFEPGPFGTPKGSGTDIYVYVRFNGGFTPSELISNNMVGWTIQEDVERHGKWHGESVTWFDVLTNKISVDRSSVGNALYLVLNLAAGSVQEASRGQLKKNFADVESWINVAPSFKKSVASSSDYSFTSQSGYNQTTNLYMPPVYPTAQIPLGNQGMYSSQNQVYYSSGNYQDQIYRPDSENTQSQMFNAPGNSNFPNQYGQYGQGGYGQGGHRPHGQ